MHQKRKTNHNFFYIYIYIYIYMYECFGDTRNLKKLNLKKSTFLTNGPRQEEEVVGSGSWVSLGEEVVSFTQNLEFISRTVKKSNYFFNTSSVCFNLMTAVSLTSHCQGTIMSDAIGATGEGTRHASLNC